MGKKKVLLLGATGLVGGEILKLMLGDPFYGRISVAGRRPVDGVTDDGGRLSQHVIDFDNLKESAAVFEVDHLVCALGTTIAKAGSKENFRKVDLVYTIEAAGLAAARGAGFFAVVSSVGANPGSMMFYYRIKGEVEKEAAKLGFDSLAVLRPSLLLGNRRDKRLGEEIGQSLGRCLSVAIPARYKPVEARDVAAAVLAAAREELPGSRIFESEEIRAMASGKDGR